jgi:hypothetical protein
MSWQTAKISTCQGLEDSQVAIAVKGTQGPLVVVLDCSGGSMAHT